MARVLFVTPEIVPIAPVGGIAEYVYGLASALLCRGHDVRVAMPAYAYLLSQDDLKLKKVRDRLVVQLGVGASEVTAVYETTLEPAGAGSRPLPVILVGDHRHFSTVHSPWEIYQWPNHEPWIAFSRAIIDLLAADNWQPDVIHCQDALAALVPVYVRQLQAQGAGGFVSSARTVLTIHNLLNQGLGPPGLVAYAGLPPGWFNVEAFEFFGQANCFKAGLMSADVVNTVSRTYAREICESDEFGFGLAGVLRRLRSEGKLYGIVNGIDAGRWRMPGLKYDGHDSVETVALAKRAARQRYFSQWGWQETGEPLIGFRGRWDNQKGVALLVECMEQLTQRARVVLCAWGTPGTTPGLRSLWARANQLAEARPDRLRVNPGNLGKPSETVWHYALSDFMLMPSQYEPCGLVQMECQRFGAIPIVRQTGGLADTVSEWQEPDFPSPNGFAFRDMTAESMLEAVQRAIDAYHQPGRMYQLIANALAQRNCWDSRVTEYEVLYGV